MRKKRKLLGTALGALLVALAFAAAPAGAMYLPDGAKDDGLGGYMNPNDGMCVVGVAADGTMLVDGSISNARDCVAWTKSADGTVNLLSLNTQAKCQVAGLAGNDGYRHAWSTSICYDTVNNVGISRVDLDNTAAMCTSKGGTVVTTGKCVAYGWVYRNRKTDGSLVPTGSGLYETTGAATADGLGFCYASMDMTSAGYADRETCPSEHNNIPPVALSVCKDANKATIATCQIASNRVWSTSLPGGPGCFVTNVNDTTACSALGAGYSWISFVSAGVAPALEWTACASNPVAGCQSQDSYDAGLGWSLPDGAAASITTGTTSNSIVRVCQDTAKTTQVDCEAANTTAAPFVFYWNPDLGICVDTSLTTSGTTLTCKTATRAGVQIVVFSDNNRCIYQYGQKGKLAATVQPVNSLSPVGIGTVVDLTAVGTQGECLAGGFSWDNWLPDIGRAVVTPTEDPNLPAATQIVKLDATTPVKDGGGNYYSGTGSVCLKCHSDQSRSYVERNKPGYVETPHKFAGDMVGTPWQPNFTAAASPWGLKGVQCTMCHSTARPANDDLIQVIPAGIVGPPAAGAPISATGHNRTEYASHVTDVCFHCHGNFPSANAASVIPIAGGDFALTGKGLAPIGNEFLNSPHARYTGTTSAKVDIGNKLLYSSTFLGYVCRSSNSIGSGNILTTVYRNGVVEKIPALDSTTNPACTNPGDGTATSGAAGFWLKDGEAISGGTPADNAQGSCMTCHDVHWDFESANPEAEPFRRECTTCHVNPGVSATNAPQIVVATINHPTSAGTPLQDVATKPYESCVICHMPKSSADGSRMHLWRVNPDQDYSTMGAANTVADGTYANAVWVDVDYACGQCHDGTGTGPVFSKAQLAGAARSMHAGGSATNADCLSCHSTAQGTAEAIVPGTNHHGLHSTCTGCHENAHDGGTIPDKTSNTFCLTCHTNSGPYAVHHAVANLTVSGSPKTCQSCHTIPGVTVPPMTTRDQIVAGCLGCHISAQGAFAAIYPRVGTPDASQTQDNHHRGSSTPHFAATTNGISCKACHGSGAPTATATGLTGAAFCAECHTVNQVTDHHDGVCLDCHKADGSFTGTYGAGVTSGQDAELNSSCLMCHSKAQGSIGAINLATLNHLPGPGTPASFVKSCVRCHKAPEPPPAPDAYVSWPGVPPDVAASCGQCHDAAHYVAAGAPLYSTADLALVADGIHDAAGVTYPVTFTATPSMLTVAVAASVTCGGTCPTFTYDWDWGDGSSTLGGTASTSHLYAAGGSKTIKLTLKLSGKTAGTYTRSIMLANPDGVPVAGGTDTWDENTWTMTIVDTSTDDGPDADAANDAPPTLQIVVNWGDGTTKTIGAAGQTFTHVYPRPGAFTVTLRATDPKLQTSTTTFAATPAYFAISGVVQDAGSVGLAGATVRVMRGTTTVKTITTTAGGAFTSGEILKPGTYTLAVTKAGYTFAKPAATLVVGPSQSDVVIGAAAPLALSPLKVKMPSRRTRIH